MGSVFNTGVEEFQVEVGASYLMAQSLQTCLLLTDVCGGKKVYSACTGLLLHSNLWSSQNDVFLMLISLFEKILHQQKSLMLSDILSVQT